MRNLINAAENELRKDIDKDTAEAKVLSKQAEMYNIAGVAGAVVLGIIIALIIIRATIRPINIIIERVKDIAQGEGDLTKRINITTKDEIGSFFQLSSLVQLAQNKARMVDQSSDLTALWKK